MTETQHAQTARAIAEALLVDKPLCQRASANRAACPFVEPDRPHSWCMNCVRREAADALSRVAEGSDDDIACRELDEVRAQRDELLAAVKAYVEWFGAAHTDGCPADDTCFCSGSAINDAVNRAIVKAEATQPPEATAPTGEQ